MPATAISKRKSHNKSRKGCSNCKSKHVKCDELGPPCANCIARKCANSCTYPNGRSPAASSTQASQACDQSKSPSESSIAACTPSPRIDERNTALSPTRYLLDLELLHHWTTQTFHSIICVPEDAHYLQIEVPRGGIRQPFLLRGLMCCAALEKARLLQSIDRETSSYYLRVALQYYVEASKEYRNSAVPMNLDNAHLLYMFTMLQGMVNMSIPQFMKGCDVKDESTLKFICTLFSLYISGTAEAVQHMDWLVGSPLGPSLISATEFLNIAPDVQLDLDSNSTLSRVYNVVTEDERHNDAESPPNKYGPHVVPTPNRLALSALHLCFVEECKGILRGFCIAFPFSAGRQYSVKIREREPVALYLLMHWGVLLERFGQNAWWASGLGMSLVHEVAALLEDSRPLHVNADDWFGGIQWCRNQVESKHILDFGDDRQEALLSEMRTVGGDGTWMDELLILQSA